MRLCARYLCISLLLLLATFYIFIFICIFLFSSSSSACFLVESPASGCVLLQDYLGGIIVFAAIITALLTSKVYPESTAPSWVGLAINYTLLVPIYLNWVVKLLSDMEMYIGAVERISHYIDDEHHQSNVGQQKEKCKFVTRYAICSIF